MIENEILADSEIAPEGLAINTNLLETLREKKGFSIERYGSLDEVFEKMIEELTRLVGGFVGCETELELAEVVLFSGVDNSSAEEEMPTLAKISDNEGQLISFISIESAVFRDILGVLLGSYSRPASMQNQPLLTVAETKLLLRFVRQIGAGLLNTLFEQSTNDVEFEILDFDDKQLIAAADKFELISTTFDISADDHTWQIKITMPLEKLEPNNQAAFDNDIHDLRRHEEWLWKEKMQSNIKKIPISLRAQIASMEMALADVASLVPGATLGIQFDLTNVKIIDADENCAFFSNIELNESGVELRVAENMGNKGV